MGTAAPQRQYYRNKIKILNKNAPLYELLKECKAHASGPESTGPPANRNNASSCALCLRRRRFSLFEL